MTCLVQMIWRVGKRAQSLTRLGSFTSVVNLNVTPQCDVLFVQQVSYLRQLDRNGILLRIVFSLYGIAPVGVRGCGLNEVDLLLCGVVVLPKRSVGSEFRNKVMVHT